MLCLLYHRHQVNVDLESVHVSVYLSLALILFGHFVRLIGQRLIGIGDSDI